MPNPADGVPSEALLVRSMQTFEGQDDLRAGEAHQGGRHFSFQQAKSNASRNRYTNILPYDHSLLPGPYINASLIPPYPGASPEVQQRSYVASQAPLPTDVPAFYGHLVSHNVRVVLMLTPLIEKHRVKADQYWPSLSSTLTLENGWSVENLTADAVQNVADVDGDWGLQRRLLRVRTAQGTNPASHDVVQLHMTSWGDFGVSSMDSLQHLLNLVDAELAKAEAHSTSPLWVHCSAGVGRSGTVIAAHMARHSGSGLQDEQDAALSLVQHMRKYRARMVQTPDQLRMVYASLRLLHPAA